jgi:hypothetical protein
MGIDDPGAISLAQTLRAQQPSLRLILIPLMGEDLSSEATGGIMIQGVLSKPFFLPELPERIEAALSAPLTGSAVAKAVSQPEPAPELEPDSQPEPAPAAAASSADSALPQAAAETLGGLSAKLLARHRAEIQGLMNVLEQEVAADAVLLTVSNQLSVWVGHLEQAEVTAIAQAAIQGWKTSAEVARILGASRSGSSRASPAAITCSMRWVWTRMPSLLWSSVAWRLWGCCAIVRVKPPIDCGDVC